MEESLGKRSEHNAHAGHSHVAATSEALSIAAHPHHHPSFDQFVATIKALRAPDGCPWDREQTHESIAHNMIEEAYEAVDAIETHDIPHVREELGDVLLQVVLQSQIAEDAGEFTIDDVCADINAKMVRRHPHVFGAAQAENASDVLDLWDQVKMAERRAGTAATPGTEAATATPGTEAATSATAPTAASLSAPQKGLLDGVPSSFPALMQAQKLSRKAAAAGFEWDSLDEVWAKVQEEVEELKEAYAAAPKAANGKVDVSAPSHATASASNNAEPEDAATRAAAAAAVEEEFGDVLFSLVNVGRQMGIDAEGALRTTCAKFRKRWSFIEQQAWAQGCQAQELSSQQREDLWQKAKQEQKITDSAEGHR